MRDPQRGTSLSIVGWLWADILLGLFALFLAANTAASASSNQTTPGVDPKDVTFTVEVDGNTLLTGSATAVAAEQQRIADVAIKTLQSVAPGRKVAIVIAYGVHSDPAVGDLLSKKATAAVTSGAFAGSTIRNEHEIQPTADGKSVVFDVYLFY
jgi:regulator of RNase E activity RraA